MQTVRDMFCEVIGDSDLAEALLIKLFENNLMIAPREADASMYMAGGNIQISNLPKKGKPPRNGRIGDMAARDAWAVMAKIAVSQP